ncbi:MAG: peptide chain release factor N(5)-glutamine methyltransferase [Gemmatimonas sp.]
MIVSALLREIETMLRASPALAGDDERGALDREAVEIVAALMHLSPGEVARGGTAALSSEDIDRIRAATARRATGEPLAYATGSAAFRHLDLHVDRRVLIPRPETEVVVEHALRVSAGQSGGVAVDVGTGSGAIALSLATEGSFDRVIATDISADALAVAQHNAERVTPPVPVEFRIGADLAPLMGIRACLIVSNPPYIAHDEAVGLPASVRDWEPALALFADDGGMERYNRLLADAPAYLAPGGWLVLELDSRRAQETARRARAVNRYRHIAVEHDLTGRERVLVAQLA